MRQHLMQGSGVARQHRLASLLGDAKTASSHRP